MGIVTGSARIFGCVLSLPGAVHPDHMSPVDAG
jgi:hypothetical protein